ncbi:hypothetical protein [Streptomyces iconiensis]|uniref:Uncharacterized protein n=1 Tax=Streptomyces iconiensis TaxID=1384038 RepID=A0ABT6ZP53_9ACTN|nr:hypothetical protein [Streptomyces iconiensis]MDJ1130647.1 hypothetical protein [Streptomyces iconiensis]
MRRSLAVAAVLVGLVLVAGPAYAETGPKGGQPKLPSSALVDKLKGVLPVLAKGGMNNR